MRCHLLLIQALAFVAAGVLLSGCKGGAGVGTSSGLPVANLAPAQTDAQGILNGLPGAGKIQHIIIVVQDGRSFNNLFYGYPGAKTAAYGYDSQNHKITLRPVTLATRWGVETSAQGFLMACNGTGKVPGTDCRMNGFNLEAVTCGGHGGEPKCPNKHPQYSYVPHSETVPYFDMAQQYVLADEMFASDFDASEFVSLQYIIAGQAKSAIAYPSGNWGCPFDQSSLIATVSLQRKFPVGFIHPCWNTATIGGELDKTGKPWAYYTTSPKDGLPSIWSAYQVIKSIYHGPDWKKDVLPQSEFFQDVATGDLRTVTWITPNYRDSDHPGTGSRTGPSWVTSIVNAVGESKYWKSSAIFVFWDQYGGWYDPEPPAYVDYDGLGMRIPLLIISPYAKKGYVSHVPYEHGSILRFIEDQFGLLRMAASDKRANSPRKDCFDFSQPPRKFVKIAAPYDQAFFLHQPIDERSPDDR